MHVDRRRFLQVSAAAATLPVVPACGGHEKTVVAGVPANSFDEDSTAEEVTEGIDLGGKIAVVTGCTSGIGLETMRVLALRGAWVLGTSRSLERAEVACRPARAFGARPRRCNSIWPISTRSFAARKRSGHSIPRSTSWFSTPGIAGAAMKDS
jgi:hypothetical protein